jgi:type II secretory pathway pseudopilin PulG
MDSTPLIVVIILGILAPVGVFIWLRSRQKQEPDSLAFYCPNCGQKLRYRLRQAGHKGACPRCRGDLVFPVAGAGGKKK